MSSYVLHNMQGPLCGTLATMILYGVVCMQVFQYAGIHGASDRSAIKWLVWCVWVLTCVHAAFSVHYIQYYLILHFNDQSALSYIVWTVVATYISGFLLACAVNLFFVWRIWKLSHRPVFCLFLAVLATVRSVYGIVSCAMGLRYVAIDTFLAKVRRVMIVGWALGAFTDSLITATLCCYFRRQHRARAEHVGTLLLYTIHTGALTSLFSCLVLITFIALQDMTFTAFVQVQSNLYAISLLSSLNSRESALKAPSIPTTDDMCVSFINRSGGKMDRYTSPPIKIRKEIEQEIFPSTLDDASGPCG